MRPSLTGRDRRALITGAVVIITLTALARGLPAWRHWTRTARTRAAIAAADVARAESRLRIQHQLTDSLDVRGKRLIAFAPALLNGATTASAGATLAGLVSGAATASLHVDAVQLLPARDSASSSTFRRVAVRVDATGDVRGVVRMLAALERGPTLLAIRALGIEQAEPAAPPDHPEALHVTLTVEGLMLAPRESTAP